MNHAITKETELSMYESMLKQRLLDEKVVELYKKGLIQGIAHPCLGQLRPPTFYLLKELVSK
jgi:TPP-dependent pyruvate/acetoin dehydrogenase alpha subunit